MKRRIAAATLALGAWFGCSGGPTSVGTFGRIGPEGGTVRLGDRAGVVVPAGALAETVTITIQAVDRPAALAEAGAVGPAYRFRPDGQTFAQPVEVFVFVPASAAGNAPDALSLISMGAAPADFVEALTGITRETVPGGVVVRGRITHFSIIVAASTAGSGGNRDPTVDAGDDRSVFVGDSVVLEGQASDPDGDALSFGWTLADRPAGSAAVVGVIDGARAAFVPDAPGAYVARLTVEDGHGGSSSDEVRIVASQVGMNRPPLAAAGPDQSVAAGAVVTLDGTGSSDPEDDVLSYRWRIAGAPGALPVLADSTAEQTTFVAADPGLYVVELEVDDGQDAGRDTVRVTALGPGANQPPVADAGPDLMGAAGSTIRLNGGRSFDVNGDVLTYAWMFVSAPGPTPALVGAATPQASFVPIDQGTYVARLTVGDGEFTSSDEATIRVGFPTAGFTVSGGFVGEAVTAASTSSDPENDPLTLAWELFRPPGSSAGLSSTSAGTTSFVPDVAGAYALRLTVSDGVRTAMATRSVPVVLSVAGMYDATFSTTSVQGCGDFVQPGSETGVMSVLQDPADPTRVTLDLQSLSPNIKTNPVGSLSPDGHYLFNGILRVGNDSQTVNASGRFEGDFVGGDVDLTFRFSAFSCLVEGTVTGTRR